MILQFLVTAAEAIAIASAAAYVIGLPIWLLTRKRPVR